MDSSPTLPLSQKGTPSQTPSKKRKRVIKVEELVDAFAAEPRNFETAWHDLRALVYGLSADATLAPSNLRTVAEALSLFDLREGKIIPFTDTPILPTPQYLQQNIARIESVTTGGQFSGNEAFSRMIIDQILVCCMYEEGQQSEQQPSGQATASAADKDSSHTPPGASAANKGCQRSDQQLPKQTTNTEREDPALLELLHETPLSRVVTHQGQTKRLCGFSDYSVWYDRSRNGKATMATNLLIVEAKRQWYTDAALPQLASYMGIVHTARKEESKQNCVVYGATSDGRSFRFCRIDNDGVFTRSPLLEWECNQDQIYTIIRSLLRAAALSSPSTTPIKDPMCRKIVLVSFGSPKRAEKFDYGVGQLNAYDMDDFEDAEIVHLDPDRQQ